MSSDLLLYLEYTTLQQPYINYQTPNLFSIFFNKPFFLAGVTSSYFSLTESYSSFIFLARLILFCIFFFFFHSQLSQFLLLIKYSHRKTYFILLPETIVTYHLSSRVMRWKLSRYSTIWNLNNWKLLQSVLTVWKYHRLDRYQLKLVEWCHAVSSAL